ncbi:MAG: tetrahydromethanopterin S-methyltransferase subunit A, partial [Chloroflexi bacterium]|nr:tetrahydromethanopterin S-methyltransferase subunit A [Chloroflexota bacterium]
NAQAVAAMCEIGYDMSGHHPKVMTPEMVETADRIITMGCGVAADSCPAVFVPSEDWGLEDPKGKSIEEVRRIRDHIKTRVENLIEELVMNSDGDSGKWTPNPGNKTQPSSGYPPEEGRYLRGNDLSPVAVCVILKWPDDEIPKEIEDLVRMGVETGAAISGTLQTENIGVEKMICNIVANPNIRYLVVCGPESPGHSVGQTLKALVTNGVGDDHKIIGSDALTPYLYNIPREAIERFRRQVKIIDLIDEGDPLVVRNAVWSCYQEQPTQFREYELFDPGAFPGETICTSLTLKVRHPWYAPRNADEQAALDRMHNLMTEIKAKTEAKRRMNEGQ